MITCHAMSGSMLPFESTCFRVLGQNSIWMYKVWIFTPELSVEAPLPSAAGLELAQERNVAVQDIVTIEV